MLWNVVCSPGSKWQTTPVGPLLHPPMPAFVDPLSFDSWHLLIFVMLCGFSLRYFPQLLSAITLHVHLPQPLLVFSPATAKMFHRISHLPYSLTLPLYELMFSCISHLKIFVKHPDILWDLLFCSPSAALLFTVRPAHRDNILSAIKSASKASDGLLTQWH